MKLGVAVSGRAAVSLDPARRRAAGRHQLAIAGAADPDDVGDRPDRRDRGQQPLDLARRSPRAPHSRRPRRSCPTAPSARPRSPAPSSDSARRRARPRPFAPLSAGRAAATAWASIRPFSCATSSRSSATSSSSRSSASNDASSGSAFTSSISLLLFPIGHTSPSFPRKRESCFFLVSIALSSADAAPLFGRRASGGLAWLGV